MAIPIAQPKYIVYHHGVHSNERSFDVLLQLTQKELLELVTRADAGVSEDVKGAIKKYDWKTHYPVYNHNEKTVEFLKVLRPNVNREGRSYAGITKCGTRLAEYLIKHVPRRASLSLAAHSFGGIIIRFALAKIDQILLLAQNLKNGQRSNLGKEFMKLWYEITNEKFVQMYPHLYHLFVSHSSTGTTLTVQDTKEGIKDYFDLQRFATFSSPHLGVEVPGMVDNVFWSAAKVVFTDDARRRYSKDQDEGGIFEEEQDSGLSIPPLVMSRTVRDLNRLGQMVKQWRKMSGERKYTFEDVEKDSEAIIGDKNYYPSWFKLIFGKRSYTILRDYFRRKQIWHTMNSDSCDAEETQNEKWKTVETMSKDVFVPFYSGFLLPDSGFAWQPKSTKGHGDVFRMPVTPYASLHRFRKSVFVQFFQDIGFDRIVVWFQCLGAAQTHHCVKGGSNPGDCDKMDKLVEGFSSKSFDDFLKKKDA